ncbi:flagellar hook-length control protein FliK [Pseudidiomarina homiensis]|uniref:Flagellar hook-length control protein-like C-terminal domain-containing protein n=1 Tax=Pseudidiomarina homiensis TaxID=364198 RepID=A0A432Y725_9GAMM|nr:flagellar hook-length control protein FliK [Pseudidiomarina homiensis]RUO56774.1 hypothetical protein CWI70_08580 [Pseudidiomarina homiensis]
MVQLALLKALTHAFSARQDANQDSHTRGEGAFADVFQALSSQPTEQTAGQNAMQLASRDFSSVEDIEAMVSPDAAQWLAMQNAQLQLVAQRAQEPSKGDVQQLPKPELTATVRANNAALDPLPIGQRDIATAALTNSGNPKAHSHGTNPAPADGVQASAEATPQNKTNAAQQVTEQAALARKEMAGTLVTTNATATASPANGQASMMSQELAQHERMQQRVEVARAAEQQSASGNAAARDSSRAATESLKAAQMTATNANRSAEQQVPTLTSTSSSAAFAAENLTGVSTSATLSASESAQTSQPHALQTIQVVTTERAQMPAAVNQASVLQPSVGTQAWQAQLNDSVVQMVMRNQNEMTLHLRPADLGPLQIQLIQDDKATQLHILTHSQHVRGALENALPMLREALQAQGLQLADSTVSQQQSSWQQSGQQEQQQSTRQSPNNPLDLRESAENNSEEMAANQSSRVPDDGRVDLYA